ncbi:MAG TPA: IS200/IS605 family transposase [Bacteroidales bacterium]|nr:IS200/IS605 family transposase [Bacteroidales bacterium]
MPYVKVMIPAVWGTKYRHPFLTNEIRNIVIAHIKENAKNKKLFIDTLDGYTDHLHCLFGLNADMSIAKAMQLIKGESAHWINDQKIIRTKFEWADEYYAVSVSESGLANVRRYINGQEAHHNKVTFAQEYEKFFRAEAR